MSATETPDWLRRFEVVLYPASAPISVADSVMVGTFGAVLFHLNDYVALQAYGGGNWFTQVATLTPDEASQQERRMLHATDTLMWTGVFFAGAEFEPLTLQLGKQRRFWERTPLRVSIIAGIGAGAGSTTYRLIEGKPVPAKPLTPTATTTPTDIFGATGAQFMVTMHAGFRLHLGEHFSIRFEVRDVLFSSYVDRVNGCTPEDIDAIEKRPTIYSPYPEGCGVFGSPAEHQPSRDVIRRNQVDPHLLQSFSFMVGFGGQL